VSAEGGWIMLLGAGEMTYKSDSVQSVGPSTNSTSTSPPFHTSFDKSLVLYSIMKLVEHTPSLEDVSDAIDEGDFALINRAHIAFQCRDSSCRLYHTVNQLKGKPAWDESSKFDTEKDKTKFRQYEDACDRVKNFYKEQHGARLCLIDE
jgi:hypothetical protein